MDPQYVFHAAGTTIGVTLDLPAFVETAWFTSTEWVAVGDLCATAADVTTTTSSDTAAVDLALASDTTIAVCQDNVVVATSTHLFANGWDTEKVRAKILQ